MSGLVVSKVKPCASIVMPVHNSGRANLEVSIGSVLAQTMPNLELVCVNDASTDCSAAVLDEIAARDPRIRVISFSENRGTLEARTAAIAAATGDYIIPLDPDDSLDPDACRRVCEAMEANGWEMAQFGIRLHLEDASVDAKRMCEVEGWFSPPTVAECSFAAFAQDVFVRNLHSWAIIGKVFRRSLLVAALGAVPSGYCVNGEDGLALLAFLESSDGRVGFIADRLYDYRWGQGISTTRAFSKTRMRNLIRSVIFASRFLEARGSQYADSYGRILMRNMMSDIVYLGRPKSFRMESAADLAAGVSRAALERAFSDLGVSHAFFNRCGLVFRAAFARTPARRRKLRRRLALARRIASLERAARDARKSNAYPKGRIA